jgi:four helix bundle protein
MEGNKIFDFELRALDFSKRLLKMAKSLPKDDINKIMINQCVRSGTSVGANYREANDALGTKDFILRLRISRKEAKETIYWLELIIENNENFAKRLIDLKAESIELTKILSKIISNTKLKQQEQADAEDSLRIE